MIQNLDVYLWNLKVGSLVTYKERYSEKICFYFDRTFLANGYDIAPLRASVNSVSVKNGLPVYADEEKLFGEYTGHDYRLIYRIPTKELEKFGMEWQKSSE